MTDSLLTGNRIYGCCCWSIAPGVSDLVPLFAPILVCGCGSGYVGPTMIVEMMVGIEIHMFGCDSRLAAFQFQSSF